MKFSIDLVEELPLLVYAGDQALDATAALLAAVGESDLGEIDASRLAGTADLRRLARILAEDTIPRSAEMMARTLGELVPGLASVSGSIGVGDVSMRLYNALGRHQALSYREIACVRPEVALHSWYSVGVKLVRELLVHTIEASFARVVSVEQPLSPYPSEATARPPESDPTAVALTPGDLLRGQPDSHLVRYDAYVPSEAAIAAAYSALIDGVPARLMTVARRRLFPLLARPTLEEVGLDMGVTRERVRQLEVKASRSIATRLQNPRCAALVLEAARVSRLIGAAYVLSELHEPWPGICVRFGDGDLLGAPDSLLLWMAGPYRKRGDWIIQEQRSGELAERTVRLVDEQLEGSVAEVDAVLRGLAALDIRPAMRRRWLTSSARVRLFGDWVVRWGSSMVDQCHSILHVAGEPMSAEQLAAAIGGEPSVRSLRNRLLDDDRFQRVGKMNWGLPEWGFDEYTTVSDEIAEEIERQGGEASLQHLVDVISMTYGVAESSIRAYASSRRFARTPRGTLRVASADEINTQTRPLELTKGCYRIGEAWAIRVRITSETLRGSGTPVPECFVAHLGLRPGEHTHLSSPFGTIRASWANIGAYLGSLRPVAEGLAAAEGDSLFVQSLGDGSLAFVLVDGLMLAGLTGDALLAASVAWGGLSPDVDPLTAIRHAVGFDGNGMVDTAAISARLRARRESELMPAITPTNDSTANEAALAELLGLLDDEA